MLLGNIEFFFIGSCFRKWLFLDFFFRKEMKWYKIEDFKWLGINRLIILVERVMCFENIICKFDK